MPLIYSLISRSGRVLCERTHPSHAGNFSTITRRIIDRIESTDTDTKLSYMLDGHSFNFRISHGFVFMCMADRGFGTEAPFVYLKRLEARFFEFCQGERLFGGGGDDAGDEEMGAFGDPLRFGRAGELELHEDDVEEELGDGTLGVMRFAGFRRELAELMAEYSGDADTVHAVGKIRSGLDDVRNVMKVNINKVLERGDRIDTLVDRTRDLTVTSGSFKRKSRTLRKNLCWANMKMKLLVIVLVLAFLYLVSASFCGVALDDC